MVVTKKEFQDMIEQINGILTKLDERLQTLEQKPVKTTKTTKSQEKDLTNS